MCFDQRIQNMSDREIDVDIEYVAEIGAEVTIDIDEGDVNRTIEAADDNMPNKGTIQLNVEDDGTVNHDDVDIHNDDDNDNCSEYDDVDDRGDGDGAGMDDANGGAAKNKDRKSYTIHHKLAALDMLRDSNNNVSLTSRRMGIPRGNLQRWIKQKSLLERLRENRRFNVRKQRRDLYKSQGRFVELENRLLDWVRDERRENRPVSGKRLRDRAMVDKQDLEIEAPFIASTGWSQRFLKRHGLVRRAVTSVGQQIPANARDITRQFLRDVTNRIEQLPPRNVSNMDEVPVYFDMPRNHTIDFKGLHTIKVNTTGHEHLRFTVVLTACSNGQKLKPMIIFKGLKNVPNQIFPTGVHVAVSMGGSMSAELMTKDYLPFVWRTRPGQLFREQAVLLMDSHASHKDIGVISTLKTRHDTSTLFIPPGMTPLLQPLDVAVNKPFKDHLVAKWEQWIAEGEVELTKGGNRKRASYAEVARWVLESWLALDRQIILRAFECCGVTRNQQKLHQRLTALLDDDVLPNDVVEILESSDSESDIE